MYSGDNNSQDAFPWLALKRHERPPPGYFDRLPSRVLARIDAQRPVVNSGWVDSLLERLQLRPALVGFLGASLGGLYFLGLAFSDRFVPTLDRTQATQALAPDPWFIPTQVVVWRPMPPPEPASPTNPSSVAPVLDHTQLRFVRPGSYFPDSSHVQRVGFSVWSP